MPKDKKVAKKPKWKEATLMRKRRAVKYAMTASMALCVYTGLKKGKDAKKLHIASGIALMGLSYYHTHLYPKKTRS
jgi:hypothetical protein